MPLRLVISRRLTRNDGVLPNLLIITLRSRLIHLVSSIRMTRVFLIQRTASKFTPVETRWLLRLMVPEADGDKLVAVRSTEV